MSQKKGALAGIISIEAVGKAFPISSLSFSFSKNPPSNEEGEEEEEVYKLTHARTEGTTRFCTLVGMHAHQKTGKMPGKNVLLLLLLANQLCALLLTLFPAIVFLSFALITDG